MAVNYPFTPNPALTAIAVGYRNPTTIADRVLPRVQVGAQTFKYLLYSFAEGITIPNTMVGRTSKPNQVELGATEASGSTKDYALDIPVPNADIEAARTVTGGYDPRARAVAVVQDLIDIDREIRVAGAVFNAANYASANKATLSGTDQWSNSASKPITFIQDAMDGMVMRPNVMVVGRQVATALMRNPEVVTAIAGSTQPTSAVNLPALAAYLGLREIIIGEAYYNTAKPGQTATVARAWGKFAALLCQDVNADANFGVTYGYTAQWGPRIAGTIRDEDMGMRGGVRVRSGESVGEFITANDLGYLFSAAIA
jgi:hypothetical protein